LTLNGTAGGGFGVQSPQLQSVVDRHQLWRIAVTEREPANVVK
jgi:hypothetical protein